MRARELSIGRVAAETGSNIQTIRYYEQIGLLSPPDRTVGGQRRYSEDHVQRLAFIRNARELGFSVEAIERMLELASNPGRPCKEVIMVAEEQLAAVRSRLSRLRALEKELKHLIASCSGARMEDCRILDALSHPRR
ncbi:MAG: helix-turn-helix domain-containing protein [Pseudomonadota bacterium]